VILNLHRVRNIPFLVVSAVGALAILSLGHLMIVAVRRRRRDLAILRALGATPRWLTAVVHWQATIIAGTVLAIAIPTGSALGRSLYRAFVEHVGARTDVTVPLAWLGATLVALLTLANLVAAVPARRTSRNSPALTLTLAESRLRTRR
jgi:ABC-type lipoprotein release transport system permease subunit